jgi:hypothetical protein
VSHVQQMCNNCTQVEVEEVVAPIAQVGVEEVVAPSAVTRSATYSVLYLYNSSR